MAKILVTGSTGQIGSELVLELRKIYGGDNVVALGNRTKPSDELLNSGPFETADIKDIQKIRDIIEKYEIDTIYHLVSLLSATGEQNPNLAWEVNMGGLKDMLDLAVEYKIKRFFWPSSIAAFGPNTPRINTPQYTPMDPTTMYGVTKVAGELLCQYYHQKYGLDTRSLRYPGIVSRKTLPGGGTTDYAVAIYYDAIQKGEYEFFVNEQTVLPMMYMPDAIKATIDIMQAEPEKIKIHTSYNLTAFSFSAKDLEENVRKYIPELKCSYAPDFRQNIANSRPASIDDSSAQKDRGWKADYDLDAMSQDMIENLKKRLS
ncbi:MAG TPA: NAD-dependent epimerase/dehydratase family protein [Candidatus Absconditabacterales bacterium]|nr:NAD-dependent epimerase/dehydratase family protein [Candidatus Absconditabacterales bacterium]HRU50548.1 NAD-dependent epimerase/dehydratase family protein [Candidatus Absconditabacterales bacterium]